MRPAIASSSAAGGLGGGGSAGAPQWVGRAGSAGRPMNALQPAEGRFLMLGRTEPSERSERASEAEISQAGGGAAGVGATTLDRGFDDGLLHVVVHGAIERVGHELGILAQLRDRLGGGNLHLEVDRAGARQ